MPTTETLERFIRRVEEGAHAEACDRVVIRWVLHFQRAPGKAGQP